ncbi:hypothetical protein [Winogradskyella echinorum]|uniref:hypothetical protein n=1 Tax=Winogradskyella echinorum TaxID=538189 RepID=UPI001C9A5DD8|nr:hypothetical protein [Winogradskyella echinorum]
MKNYTQNKKTIALHYKKQNILKGALIYSAGDTIAVLLLDEFSLTRLLGMMLVGATFYAFEIPNYFDWIVKKTQFLNGIKATLVKTGLAIAYFNPLWIARHLLFIKLFSGQFEAIGWNLLEIAFWSFLANILISFIANYIIQNRFKLKWRFLGSAIFSALMAIYYALSETLFS